MISLCLTTWNRDDMVIHAIEKVLHDSRISEIVIVDDASDAGIFSSLKNKLKFLRCPKIKLFRNKQNLDCYRNKRKAVSKATNNWVILFDSDNVIDKTYLDSLERIKKICDGKYNKKIIYAPTFARPHFNYTSLSKVVLYKRNAASVATRHQCFSTAINTANYFFNKNEFLRVWDKYDDGTNPHTADTIRVNYHWILEGNIIFFVPDMKYNHLIHPGSHYQNNVHKTGNLASALLQKFKELK